MKSSLSTLVLLCLSPIAFAQVPYNVIPDWQSNPNGHIATGLGLADINGDGWKDLVVANGNDIQRQHAVVYYNNGDGTFPQNPDWQSEDIDYHGHLACGDIDQDGDIDIAVSVYIGATGFNSPGRVKVYYNEGTELEAIPSFISNPFYTFSCTLGDADGDGDLDLATTAGEPYNDILDHGKIFINNNGTFQAEPEWESDIEMGSLDVEFGDINRDGFMDVIFICENTDNYIYLGEAGGISTAPAWQSAEPQSFINSVDIGYRGQDECMVVMTENSQLGGQGKVRRYSFAGTVPASSSADWYSNPFGYGSGIILSDVDLDATLDLVYGGWWLPVKIALGEENGFQQTPEYTSSTNSVVEAIQMADLGRESVQNQLYSITIGPEWIGRHVLIIPDQLVEEITGITRNGILVEPTQYCMVPNKPWISFEQAFSAGEIIEIHYNSSPHSDMVITNWDSGKGNYIFYNTNSPVGFSEESSDNFQIDLYPNPAGDLLNVRFRGISHEIETVRITDLSGRLMMETKLQRDNNQHTIDVSLLNPGGYFLRMSGKGIVFIKKR